MPVSGALTEGRLGGAGSRPALGGSPEAGPVEAPPGPAAGEPAATTIGAKFRIERIPADMGDLVGQFGATR